ncbi:hypothetical protein B0F90DRAFT_1348227 [Multifurca ochricompacta]|uniref:Secreted protein n=1 Tax=Multifurca ochricompacta TaxID=376703 RepID=A0AAD4LXY2_9AGAM|nr:hypothetical protein B0F90DRAFT_1348227 [Multifurca ochricompacta]
MAPWRSICLLLLSTHTPWPSPPYELTTVLSSHVNIVLGTRRRSGTGSGCGIVALLMRETTHFVTLLVSPNRIFLAFLLQSPVDTYLSIQHV